MGYATLEKRRDGSHKPHKTRSSKTRDFVNVALCVSPVRPVYAVLLIHLLCIDQLHRSVVRGATASCKRLLERAREMKIMLQIALVLVGGAALQASTPTRSSTVPASTLAPPPEAAEDVLPLDVGERQALSVTERLGRSLTFYSRVLPILARYKLAELDLEQRCADEEECAAEYSELDDWGSDKLRDAILELQGFYVKSGQVLSTRVDLFAKPYCDKLQVLQEGLAPIPTDVVKEVVRRELCGDGTLDELFAAAQRGD